MQLLLALTLPDGLQRLPFLLLGGGLQLAGEGQVFSVVGEFPTAEVPLFLFYLVRLSVDK